MTNLLRAGLLLAAALAVPPSIASAQSTTPECAADLQAGLRLAKKGQRPQARGYLARAYSVCRTPVALFNIGMTWRQDKQAEEAIKYLTQFLEEARADHPMRAVAEKVIRELSEPAPMPLDSKTGTPISRLQAQVDGEGDGSNVANPEVVRRQPDTNTEPPKTAALTTGTESSMDVEDAMDDTSMSTSSSTTNSDGNSKVLGHAFLASGIAGIGIGGFYFFKSGQDADAAKKSSSFVEHGQLEDRAQSRRRLSLISLGVGVALLGGAYWQYTTHGTRESSDGYSMTPVLSPGFAGFAVGGEL